MPQDPYYGIHQLAGNLAQMAQFDQRKKGMATELAMKYIPHVTYETYDDFQDWNKQMGSMLPTPDLGSPDEFNRWQSGPQEYKDYTLSPGQKRISGRTGEVLAEGSKKLPSMTVAGLTAAALDGDKEAQAVLQKMEDDAVRKAGRSNEAIVGARLSVVDIEGTAKGIVEGRILMKDVKNTFGVPVQEAVRQKVLELNPDFNFLVPEAAYKSLSSSLRTQEKQRGLMGSFVRNLNKQISRVDEMGQELGRLGVRVLDLPKREAITRLKGSGAEKAYEAYMIEISNEIAKLSTGSAASIRELSTDAQERWAKIHDPNLSLNQMKKILDETRRMAEMRISSTNEEINFTKHRIQNLMSSEGGPTQTPTQAPVEQDVLNMTDEQILNMLTGQSG